MSDDADGFTYQPARSGASRRRVPMLIAIPVVAGCAAIGTVAGMLQPAPPAPPTEHSAALPAHVLSTSPEVVESSRPAPNSAAPSVVPSVLGVAKAASPADAPVVDPPRQRELPEPAAAPAIKPTPQNEAPAPSLLLKTGSVEQSPQAIGEDVALRPDNTRVETPTRLARAKRMRHAHMRRMRPTPPGSSTDKFFSSLFPVMPK